MQEFSLEELKVGETAKIIKIIDGKQAAKRLADLGLTPNTKIKIIRKAPAGGPLQVEARHSKLIIGKGLASKVLVRKTNE